MDDIRTQHLKEKEYILKNQLREKEFKVFTAQLKEIQKKIEKKIGTSIPSSLGIKGFRGTIRTRRTT